MQNQKTCSLAKQRSGRTVRASKCVFLCASTGCGEHLIRTMLARECSAAMQAEDAHQALLEAMQNKFIGKTPTRRRIPPRRVGPRMCLKSRQPRAPRGVKPTNRCCINAWLNRGLSASGLLNNRDPLCCCPSSVAPFAAGWPV